VVSLGKHVVCDAFALIILQAKTQRNLGEAERPETGRLGNSGRYQSVQSWTLKVLWTGKGCPESGRVGGSGRSGGV